MRRVEAIEQALERKFPEWIVFVVAVDKAGRPNLMPAGWCMQVSHKPPMVAVSIAPQRYTHGLIEQSGEFVVAWPGEGQQQLISFAGSTSGRDVDKFAEAKLKTAPPAVTKVPLLEGCGLCLECKVTNAVPAGDHTIFVGEVVAAHVSERPIANIINFGQERFAPAKPAD